MKFNKNRYNIKNKKAGKEKLQSLSNRLFHKDEISHKSSCVVPNADGLSTAQMQQIARELNNSETAFIFAPPKGADYDAQVRFFTPNTEVPLCGHATIAAHYVRAILSNTHQGGLYKRQRRGF